MEKNFKGDIKLTQDYLAKDINLAPEGQLKIDWVAKWMHVLNRLADKFTLDNPFNNKRVALCIHLEAKTAHLAFNIQKLGAEVWITSSNTLSTKDEVAAALAKNGLHVFAMHGASHQEYHSYLKSMKWCFGRN